MFGSVAGRALRPSVPRAAASVQHTQRGIFVQAQQWYIGHLQRSPLPTKAITAFIVVGAGDAFCQKFVEKTEHFSVRRWLNASFLGGILVGPSMHTWFAFLARTIPGADMRAVLTRLLIDRLMFAPLFIPTYITCLMTLEGRLAEVPQKLRDAYVPTVLINWKIWFPAQFVTFRFIPLQYQVLWTNVVSVLWNVALSFATHNDHTHTDPAAGTLTTGGMVDGNEGGTDGLDIANCHHGSGTGHSERPRILQVDSTHAKLKE